jgi:NADH/NAD ratio-sensing transcriptional regulator Rex
MKIVETFDVDRQHVTVSVGNSVPIAQLEVSNADTSDRWLTCFNEAQLAVLQIALGKAQAMLRGMRARQESTR